MQTLKLVVCLHTSVRVEVDLDHILMGNMSSCTRIVESQDVILDTSKKHL